jgi:DNA-binding HxlR family transcriptional regulator
MSPASGPYPSESLVPIEACPIATSLEFLGRRWTITILRDVAFIPKAGFALIRRRNPGLRQRTLSNRLRELAREGFIDRIVPEDDPRHPYYELTEQGREVWPILASLFQFGIRHHARTVFADGQPRDLSELYPNDAGLMLGPLARFAARATEGGRARSSASRARVGSDV